MSTHSSTCPGAHIQIITSIRQSSQSIRFLSPEIQVEAIASYQKALHAVFSVGMVLAVLSVIVALGIKEVDMKAAPGVKKVVTPREEEEA